MLGTYNSGMFLSWFRQRRRQKLLAEPFPPWWLPHLERNVGHYPRLAAAEQARLRDIIRILIAEKQWLARGGLLSVTEEMMVTIAAQAALLLLGAERGYFPRVKRVVVFPTEFRTPVAGDDWEDDFLSDIPHAGQAVDRGPVLLAWDEVLHEGRNPQAGFNVVVHEFAHQLDFVEGLALGTPHLGQRDLETRWKYVLAVAFADHRRAIRQQHEPTFFTPYAAENEAEFFADATEAFYCRPGDLKKLYPAIYELLAAYYRVDPLTWWSDQSGEGEENAERIRV
ncbi:MAG: zinc-dependent peptidase [Gemmataceae bacterium]|nr:zinc-dependent peptidase [Gemmata sp.]MDW8198194.1 zinc-dependent peptidase [Gemmataceae bacterium]